MVEKLIRDGRVAVIYAPGYGAGWSTGVTYNSDAQEILMFDKDIAQAVLEGDNDKAVKIATAKCSEEYFSARCAEQLKIEWVPVGCLFQVREYDGSEYVSIRDRMDWFVA